MGDTVVMHDRNGDAYDVPVGDVAGAAAQGFTQETGGQHAERLASDVQSDQYGGPVGTLATAGTSLLSGATLGLSDVGLSALGAGDTLRKLRAQNPTTSTIGNIAGAVLPALGGDFAGFTPAGALSNLAGKATALGEGAGLVGRTLAHAAGGAIEGAGQNAGNYLAQTALEDKPLSAEGFVGAMGQGAMWGGGTAGALSLAGSALMRAKALFPQQEITQAAAQKIDQQASSEIGSAMDDGQTMTQAATQKLDLMRMEARQKVLASQGAVADARAAQAQSALEAQQAKTARAVAGPKPRTRKVFDTSEPGFTPGPETPLPPEAVAPPYASQGAPISLSGAPSELPGYNAPTTLEQQLAATKAGLDSGTSLADLSSRDEALAATNPDAAKLLDADRQLRTASGDMQDWLAKYGETGGVGKFERSQAARDYAEGMRSKAPGWQESTPAGEGNAMVPRGRTAEFRGTEADRAAWEQKFEAGETPYKYGKISGDEASRAESAIDDMQLRGMGRTGLDDVEGRARFADRVLGEPATPAPSVQEQIEAGLGKRMGEHADLTPDINEAARVIGNYEKASADMADALGSDAPVAAADRAKAYRAAVADHAEASAASSAKAASDIGDKLQPAVAKATGGDLRGLASKAGDAAGVMELLGSLGGHVPLLHAIPVVGPILSTFLKAKALMGIYRRLGGSVGATAEGVIASKAAVTRNRMNAAVQKVLDTGGKVVQRAAPKAGAATAVLAHSLFPGPSASKGKTDVENYQARMADLARAQRPGAIESAITDRIKTSDPTLLASIVDVKQRGLAFLDSKAPRAVTQPTLLPGDGKPWAPSKTQLAEFARYVKAVDDPASVIEDLAHGGQVTLEGAETLRTVYPQLYAEAQRMLVQNASKLDATLPYARRVSLSILFQVPVDGTMSSSHIQFLSAPGAGAVQPQMQGPGNAPASPSAPGLTGPVQMGTRSMTSLDRRAGA